MWCGYLLQELSVWELTLATEGSHYGVRLQGEPDTERLGNRLKGEFKKVSQECVTLQNQHTTVLFCASVVLM